MDDVQRPATAWHYILLEAVQLGLLGPPVVAVAPIGGELLHGGEVRAILPAGAGDFIWPVHAVEALAEVGEHGLGHLDREGVKRFCCPATIL
jgi:hypothetical protein